jgi:hypothetical protein
MIAVAVVLLVAVHRARRDRRGRTGLALTLVAVLAVGAGGGLSVARAPAAQAASSDCSGSVVGAGDGAQDETVVPDTDQPGGTPVDPEVPPVDPEEPVVPEPTVYAASFPDQSFSQPPSGENYTQQHALELRLDSGEAGTGPVVLVVPDQVDGYWVATALLEADGSIPADVAVTRVDGATRFEIAIAPTSGSPRAFEVVLRYDTSTWDGATHVRPDGSSIAVRRPATTLSVQVEATGVVTSLEIPRYAAITPAP